MLIILLFLFFKEKKYTIFVTQDYYNKVLRMEWPHIKIGKLLFIRNKMNIKWSIWSIKILKKEGI